MKFKVVALPEGKPPVRTREILDKTSVDLEQETAGVQKALIVIQATEPGVQYIPLVPVAIQTPAKVVEYIQLALQPATPKARNAPELRGYHVIYCWYLTQRPIPLKRSMRLIPMHKVSTRRAHS